MHKRIVLPAVAAVLAVAIPVVALVTADTDERPAPSDFVIYEHDDLYWAFRHSDTICDTARNSMKTGLDARDVADEAIGALPAEADTEAVALYVRGLLRGCLS